MKKVKSKSGREKVWLSVRLDHQVEFGENVVILGSTKELGLWKKKVKMNWTENGWVCDLELRESDSVEFKFVIVTKDKGMVWESGNNRMLKLPRGGSFGMVCHWNVTGETPDLLPLGSEDYEEEVEDVDENANGVTLLEVERSPFVGQWQGKNISFMRSNEHINREFERKWDTLGLEGLALKLVEGDRSARNWWRKVMLLVVSCGIFCPEEFCSKDVLNMINLA